MSARFVIRWRDYTGAPLGAYFTGRPLWASTRRDALVFDSKAEAKAAARDRGFSFLPEGPSPVIVRLVPKAPHALEHWKSRAEKAEAQLEDAKRVLLQARLLLRLIRTGRPHPMDDLRARLDEHDAKWLSAEVQAENLAAGLAAMAKEDGAP